MRKKIAAFRPENVLTRSKEKADRYGFDFFGFPVFELVERKAALNEIEDVFNARVDIVVFTSLNGVKKSFSICEEKFELKNKLLDTNIEICAIGPVTRKELEKHGVRVDLMPEEYSAKGLMKLLGEGVETKKIVFLRSSEAGQDILKYLSEKGAFVKDISVYKVEILYSKEEEELFSEFVSYKPDYIIFTSSLTFKTFLELARKFGMAKAIFEVLERAKIVAIGDLTAETIYEEGMNVDLVAEKSTFEDVLKQLKRE